MKDQLLDEASRKELFVEMCFFARLGYVQPPCCLQCLYQEAMENTSTNHHCERWVVFRKDTTIPLHPDYLQENIAFVRCCTVRQLLATTEKEGNKKYPVVDGFVFDAEHCRFRKAKASTKDHS